MTNPFSEGDVLTADGLRLDPRARLVNGRNGPIELSPVEFELLRALMARPGQVVSRAQLEDWLRGRGRMTRGDALPVHIHHLRRKIGAHRIRTVRGAGYLVPHDSLRW